MYYGFFFQLPKLPDNPPLPPFTDEKTEARRGVVYWEGDLGPECEPGASPLQESQASWLDAVVPHLAEILQLEDTPSIQVEVGVLVRDYPDIR